MAWNKTLRQLSTFVASIHSLSCLFPIQPSEVFWTHLLQAVYILSYLGRHGTVCIVLRHETVCIFLGTIISSTDHFIWDNMSYTANILCGVTFITAWILRGTTSCLLNMWQQQAVRMLLRTTRVEVCPNHVAASSGLHSTWDNNKLSYGTKTSCINHMAVSSGLYFTGDNNKLSHGTKTSCINNVETTSGHMGQQQVTPWVYLGQHLTFLRDIRLTEL